MKKIFLENLPRKSNNRIDWKQCEGCNVKCIINNIEHWIKIINYISCKESKNNKLKIMFNNEELIVDIINFKNCCFKNSSDSSMAKICNFKINIGKEYKDDKRDLVITDRTKIKYKNGQWLKYYKYKCNICGFNSSDHYSIKDKKIKEELWTLEVSLLSGKGCSCCSNQIVVEGINDIPTTVPWMIPYFQGGYDEAKLYTKSSGQKIYPVCPDCGRVKKKTKKISEIYETHSIGCSCGDGQSYPNKFAFNMLEQLQLDFIPEYSPKWIGRKLYDFYFKSNSKEYILEMDGGFHYIDNKMNGQTKEESKAIDDYKDKLAKEHGIEVIRIDCSDSSLEYIKQNILNSRLNELFDLSKISWNIIDKFALSNRVKEVCNLWNYGIYDIIKIAELAKLSNLTVIKYLKKGKQHCWCDYNHTKPIKNNRKSRQIKHKIHKSTSNKFNNKLSKPVEIFKDGISLGVFESTMELERRSEELFGVKLNSGNTSLVCNKKIKSNKGFTFKYV